MTKLTDKQAWALIDQMGWGRSSKNYAALAREWYAKLGKTGMDGLQNFVGARVSDLYHAVEKYEATGKSLEIGSDDGMSDLTHHVVGLGQAEFDACIANPKLLARRYDKGDYEESFAYCFLEPEKPRTQEQKEQTQEALLQAVTELDKAISKIDNELASLRGLLTRTVTLARIMKEDKKTS